MNEDAPWIVADSSAEALKAQLGEVWDSLGRLGETLSDLDWTRPSPCPGWKVAAQYAHMIGTESVLLGRSSPEGPETGSGQPDHVRNDIGGFNEIWVAALDSWPRQQVLAEFAEVTGARKEMLARMGEDDFDQPSWTPVGQADYRRYMQIRVFDCWVHEQDVRDAVDRPGHESGPVAEQSVDEIVRAIGYIVGKKAGAPAGSSVRITLTGPVERSIDVAVIDGRARPRHPTGYDPTAGIALSSSAFTRLACGRLDPAAVLDGARGGVLMSGDQALAEKLATSLAFTI
jgi:uncharacterized protein (TIGR03083 family)